MKTFCKVVVVIVAAGLVGCATRTPPTVDVSDSIYQSDAAEPSVNLPISAVSIENYIAKEKMVISINPLVDKQFIVERTPDPRVVVEEDLERYFLERLMISPDAPRNIQVQIDKVRIYVSTPAERDVVASIPIIGLLALLIPAEIVYEYVMQVKLTVEVKETSNIVATYQFDETFMLERKSGGIDDENAIYNELFAEYRQTLFTELDEKLIGKHFSKSPN